MNSQPEEDLQRRLQNLAAEIKSAGVNPPQPEAQTPLTGFSQWNFIYKDPEIGLIVYQQLKSWQSQVLSCC